uniref:Uncharacterized protein n=1 Tax=Zea mays TaxID=4577 RepID=A0A804LES7_MAIZE
MEATLAAATTLHHHIAGTHLHGSTRRNAPPPLQGRRTQDVSNHVNLALNEEQDRRGEFSKAPRALLHVSDGSPIRLCSCAVSTSTGFTSTEWSIDRRRFWFYNYGGDPKSGFLFD